MEIIVLRGIVNAQRFNQWPQGEALVKGQRLDPVAPLDLFGDEGLEQVKVEPQLGPALLQTRLPGLWIKAVQRARLGRREALAGIRQADLIDVEDGRAMDFRLQKFVRVAVAHDHQIEQQVRPGLLQAVKSLGVPVPGWLWEAVLQVDGGEAGQHGFYHAKYCLDRLVLDVDL